MGRPVVHWELWSKDPEQISAEYRRRIESAGGRIMVERQEVPGVGAFSLFEDPDGRVLGIWQQESS